jgi:DNA (cytosine-5)-methyltransferase 1
VRAYYNEIEPYAAQWLRNLIAGGHIPAGDLDERSIVDVRPDDLKGYTQCHFFAGIAGWAYALKLAGWDATRPVWTGSCPCQPFSSAGSRESAADKRHLWPHWVRLIGERRPPTIFGEQVVGAIADRWWDAVAHDLEALAYATGAAVLPACSVGAPHQRDRLWFVADANGEGKSDGAVNAQVAKTPCAMGDADLASADAHAPESGSRGTAGQSSWWRIEPGMGRVAHGIPARVGKLRAYGNAIVPQVAAEFIKATMP